MYWLRWHYHVKDIAGAPYKIKKKRKQKRQNRRQSVVAGRQQLYCAVQSRSPNHCQTTTGKVVFSSRRNVVSDGAFLTDDGRLFHARAVALTNLNHSLNILLEIRVRMTVWRGSICGWVVDSITQQSYHVITDSSATVLAVIDDRKVHLMHLTLCCYRSCAHNVPVVGDRSS